MGERKFSLTDLPQALYRVRPGRTFVSEGRMFVSGELLRLHDTRGKSAVKSGDVEKMSGPAGRESQTGKRVW